MELLELKLAVELTTRGTDRTRRFRVTLPAVLAESATHGANTRVMDPRGEWGSLHDALYAGAMDRAKGWLGREMGVHPTEHLEHTVVSLATADLGRPVGYVLVEVV